MEKVPATLRIVLIGCCAALYAIGCYLTGFIVSPWGRGQFRPAVIIPAVFAFVDPVASGAGASIGTLIADSAKHGALYIPSLAAAVPGNFIGFYLFGRIVKKGRDWSNFLIASLLSMIVGNAIVAFLYVPVIKVLGILPQLGAVDMVLLATGLFIWFFATEFPFIVILVPPIVRALNSAIPSLVPYRLEMPSARRILLSTLGPGIPMILLSLAIYGFQGNIVHSLSLRLGSAYALSTVNLIWILLAFTGALFVVVGVLTAILLRR